MERATELLQEVGKPVVDGILVTLTRGKVVAPTHKDAIKAVLQNTSGPADLLNLRKVHRDALYQYLQARGVSGIRDRDRKDNLVARVITMWNGDGGGRGVWSARPVSPSPPSVNRIAQNGWMDGQLSLYSYE